MVLTQGASDDYRTVRRYPPGKRIDAGNLHNAIGDLHRATISCITGPGLRHQFAVPCAVEFILGIGAGHGHRPSRTETYTPPDYCPADLAHSKPLWRF